MAFLDRGELSERGFAPLTPDAKGNWLSTEHEDWAGYLPLADPTKGPGDAHAAKVEAVFRLSSNGIVTQRDDWMWDSDRRSLTAKVKALINSYESVRTKGVLAADAGIKWDTELDRYLARSVALFFDKKKETYALYRPFCKNWLYFDSNLNGRTYRLSDLYQGDQPNPGLIVSDKGWRSSFATLATDLLPDAHALASIDRYFVVTRYRYTPSGERVDNITDWALARFRQHYADPAITKDDIFVYCYAALHDPIWRATHADDLRREFPRVKLHADFARWRDWGTALLKLHIDYEKVKPFTLTRADAGITGTPVAKLRSVPEQGLVIVDTDTQITGIPPVAWSYRLGNRSAIDWVLDQHKEKKPRDPTIAARFNTYRFADYKERMIALLAKVVRVSVDTVAITDAMEALDRSGWEGADDRR